MKIGSLEGTCPPRSYVHVALELDLVLIAAPGTPHILLKWILASRDQVLA
jgi:hypothetical protein